MGDIFGQMLLCCITKLFPHFEQALEEWLCLQLPRLSGGEVGSCNKEVFKANE